MRGLHLRKPGKTLSQTEPMTTKIDELFATLRTLIADQSRNLALAMAEQDKAVTSLKDAGFTIADGAERWKPPVNERMGELYRRLFSLTDERDKLRLTESYAVAGWNKAVIERDNSRQSLRAAEADAAETESVNSDLRTVNARLIAERDAAIERLNHAESIIMQ